MIGAHWQYIFALHSAQVVGQQFYPSMPDMIHCAAELCAWSSDCTIVAPYGFGHSAYGDYSVVYLVFSAKIGRFSLYSVFFNTS